MIKFEDKLNKIVRLENPVCTIQTIIALYVGSSFFNCICNSFLGVVGYNVLFLFPLAYKLKKTQIDELYKLVKTQALNILQIVESKIPRYTGK